MATQLETAKQIWSYLTGKGWTQESVAALLGNMQSESGIIADRWESDNVGNLSGGYGLVQWTPATKYIDWAKANGLTYQEVSSQCKRLEWEVANGQQFYHPSMTFAQFTKSTQTPEALADIFIRYYERPANPNQPARQTQARYWYNQFHDTEQEVIAQTTILVLPHATSFVDGWPLEAKNRGKKYTSSRKMINASGTAVKFKIDQFGRWVHSKDVLNGYGSMSESWMSGNFKDSYYIENTGYIKIRTPETFFKGKDFKESERVGKKMSAGTRVQTTGMDRSSTGMPVFVCPQGYLTTDKKVVVAD